MFIGSQDRAVSELQNTDIYIYFYTAVDVILVNRLACVLENASDVEKKKVCGVVIEA